MNHHNQPRFAKKLSGVVSSNSMFKTVVKRTLLGCALISTPVTLLAANYMPFVMGSSTSGATLDSVTATTKAALVKQGFELAGEYAPNRDSRVLVVTNAALINMAGLSKHGGFGAMERIAVVKKGGDVQVSYTNPAYMWNVYRMEGDIAPVQNALQSALGAAKEFGATEAISDADLRKYQYKMMMPYFDDEDALAEFDSHEAALNSVEAGLKAHRAGAQKVYRIDVPGKKMSVFGVALSHKEGADSFISQAIDTGANSHSAHFPYEVLVVDNQVMALNGKFRIAINWPSLSMMGSNSFMSIANAPDHIAQALTAVANNAPLDAE